MEPTRTATSEPRRVRRGPGGPRRLALLGAALLALLALVALASRGHRSPGGGELADREPPSVFWDYLFSLSLALGLLSLLIGAWLVVSGRGAEVPPQRKRRNLAGLVLLAVVLIAVSLSTRFVDPRRETPGGNPPSSAAPRLEPARAHPGPQPTRREFRWLPVLLVAGAGALAAAYFVAR
ncbi:MAG: hypothetical protein H0V40_01995, partial [Actinobacteria bacterium]|nr:hypothetical protein [Actinomycetota bacterium]